MDVNRASGLLNGKKDLDARNEGTRDRVCACLWVCWGNQYMFSAGAESASLAA